MSLQFECDAERFSAEAEDIENTEKNTWVEEVLMQLNGSLFCWEIESEEENNKRKIWYYADMYRTHHFCISY